MGSTVSGGDIFAHLSHESAGLTPIPMNVEVYIVLNHII